jgi:predicted nucleic acid-binding protein
VRRIYVDTSVLFPFSVMDLFLALAEDSVHQVLWSDELLEEWERVIVREHQRSPESAAAITDAIREFFDDFRVDPASYCSHIAKMPGPDADDHVHSAAAIAGGAEMLVTWDRSGFPTEDLAELGLRVTDPDAYLCELLDDIGDQVVATLEGLARSKSRPPMSTGEILGSLERAGLPTFTARVRGFRT